YPRVGDAVRTVCSTGLHRTRSGDGADLPGDARPAGPAGRARPRPLPRNATADRGRLRHLGALTTAAAIWAGAPRRCGGGTARGSAGGGLYRLPALRPAIPRRPRLRDWRSAPGGGGRAPGGGLRPAAAEGKRSF